MNINNTYDIIKTPKLIDLNGDLTKFESEFKVSSNVPFYIAVVNQKMLDNNEIQFRPPENKSSGTVKYERDEHIPHYLVLKSDLNCKVNVNIKTKPLESPIKLGDYAPKKPPTNQNSHPQITPIYSEPEPNYEQYNDPYQDEHEQYIQNMQNMQNSQLQQSTKRLNFGTIVIICIIAALFGGVFLFSKKKKPVPVSIPFPLTQNITPPSIINSPSPPPLAPPSFPQLESANLLDKIKSFPIT